MMRRQAGRSGHIGAEYRVRRWCECGCWKLECLSIFTRKDQGSEKEGKTDVKC